jgi:hypothetical protein
VSVAAFNLPRMEATFASSVIGLVKDSLGLKLDTPFKLLTSLICCLTLFGSQRTPLQSTGSALSWLGWHNGARWVEPARQWLTGPSHIQFASSVFVFLAATGVGFATFGTRAPFFAWLGICGLIEIGANVAAWWWPIAAFLTTSLVGRIQDRKYDRYRWDHCALTFLALAAACLHLPATVIAVIIGENQRTVPPTVRVELSYEGRRELDERLTALGFPLVGPRPHSGRRAHPMPLTMPKRWLTASDGAA